MPLYDYHCSACDKTFELLVRSSTVPVCPSCGSDQLQRLVSRPAPQGKSAGMVSQARAQAAREGHFSHYSSSERPRSK
jgi:putative FmdB family regulatory protein